MVNYWWKAINYWYVNWSLGCLFTFLINESSYLVIYRRKKVCENIWGQQSSWNVAGVSHENKHKKVNQKINLLEKEVLCPKH